MKPRHRFLLLFTSYILLAGLPLSAQAGASSVGGGDLLRLVPDDVGFCLVIQDLRGHADAFLGSPFVAHFRKSPLGMAIRLTPESQKMSEAEIYLQKTVGIGWAKLLEDILGDAVVLAYRPGPLGHPEQEMGVVLVHARNAELLAEVVNRLNDAAKQSGELKQIEIRKHNNIDYMCRVEAKGNKYVYVRGPLLAVSFQETALQRIIDLERSAAPKNEPLIARRLRELSADKALAALWINPRVFDAEIADKAKEATGHEAAVRKAVLTYWQALDGIAISLALGQSDVAIKLSLLARSDGLPAATRKLFASDGHASELWASFPGNALFAIAGRFDTTAWDDFGNTFLTEDGRKAVREAVDRGAGSALGKDIFRDVLPNLGPDWGYCITAPPAAAKPGWFPRMIWALRVRPGDKKPAVDRTLLDGLNTLAMLSVVAFNLNHPEKMTLQVTDQDHVLVKYLACDSWFPPGLQPAFAYKDGYLLLASSPAAIQAFRVAKTVQPADPTGELPLMRLSLRELRGYLKDHREAIVSYLADKHKISKGVVAQQIMGVLTAIQLFERLELTQRAMPPLFTLTLHLHTEFAVRQ